MKVIFVDDSKIVLKTLNLLVLDMIESGMIECEFLNDSTAVQEMLEDERLEYDLMFLDIFMPNVSGYEIAKMAKSKEKYKDKTIIAITSAYSDEEKAKGKEVGIDEWFIKSISQDSLQSSIEDAIQKLCKA